MRCFLRTSLASLCLLVASSLTVEASAAEAPAAATPAATSATEAFRAQHSKVEELTKAHAESAKIEAAVDSLLDYHSLAVDSLGGAKRFPDRCESRCDELEQLLARLIRENYMRRVRTDKDHTVSFIGEETRGKSVRVKTSVEYREEGRPVVVEVTYVMHQSEGAWRVRDIITDGVRLARNYKYEFNQLLKKEGIDGLVARLESKVTMVAKKK